MPKISVIVPIYKVEKYLNRCIDSILNQTFTDFECILVDDGSPDKCPQICDEYAKKDKRVKVIHKLNGGLSDARNAGIEIAKGEYLSFVDSDDWIHPQMLEILYSTIKTGGAGFVSCGMQKVFNDECDYQVIDTKDVINAAEVYDSDLIFSNFTKVFFWKIGPYACGKLYKKQCFDNLRYDISMKLYEDEYIYTDIIDVAGTVGLVKEKLYYYFQSDNSLIRNKVDERFFLTFKSLQHISDFMRKKQIYDEMYLFELRWLMGYMDLYYRIKDENRNIIKKFKTFRPIFLNKCVKSIKNPKVTRAYKVLLVLFLLNTRMARVLYRHLTK